MEQTPNTASSKKLSFKILRNKFGFTLIEILMSVLITSISLMGVALLTSLMARSTVKINNKNSFDSMKYDLVSNVFTQRAWDYTLNSTSNPSLDCFKKNTDCRGRGGPTNGKLIVIILPVRFFIIQLLQLRVLLKPALSAIASTSIQVILFALCGLMFTGSLYVRRPGIAYVPESKSLVNL